MRRRPPARHRLSPRSTVLGHNRARMLPAIAVALTLTLTACTGSEDNSSDSSNSAASGDPSNEPGDDASGDGREQNVPDTGSENDPEGDETPSPGAGQAPSYPEGTEGQDDLYVPPGDTATTPPTQPDDADDWPAGVRPSPLPEADPATCETDPALCPPPPPPTPAEPTDPGDNDGGGNDGGGNDGGGDTDPEPPNPEPVDPGPGPDPDPDPDPEPDTSAPTTPGDLSLDQTTFNSALISWSPSTDNVGVTRYAVALNGEVVGETAPGDRKFLFTDLRQLTSYTYSVIAYDAAGNASEAATGGFLTPIEPIFAPDPPDVAVEEITLNSALVTWTAVEPNLGTEISYYTVRLDGEEQAVVDVEDDPDAALEANLSGLTPDTEYVVTVTATDNWGNESSPTTVTLRTATDEEPPSTVSTLIADDVTDRRVTLSWTDDATDNIGVTGYRLYLGEVEIAHVNADTTSYRYEELEPATDYTFRIRAVDDAGNLSEPTETTVTTPPLDNTAPGPVTAAIEATPGQSGEGWTVTWQEVTDDWTPADAVRYQVIVAGVIVAEYTGSETLSYLGEGANQNVVIRAVDEAGNFSTSATLISPEPTLEPQSVPHDEDTSEEPAAEQVEEPAAEQVEEPAAEQVEEPAAEQVEEPAAEQVEEPAAEQVEEPAAEQVEDSPTEPQAVQS